jgi:hypothetical protein
MSWIPSIVPMARDAVVYRKGRSGGFGWDKERGLWLLNRPRCEICGYLPSEDEDSNDVHHIVPRHIDPSRLLDQANFMTLCRRYSCHLRFGHFGNYVKYWNPRIREIFLDCGGRMATEEAEMYVRFRLPRAVATGGNGLNPAESMVKRFVDFIMEDDR